MTQTRDIKITEHPEVPPLSILLGYGPMLPIAAAAVASWMLDGDLRNGAIQGAAIYTASIVAFLGGVRRGVSFRTEGGPQVAQLVTMAALWLTAFLALLCVNVGMQDVALTLLILAASAIAYLDPIAAQDGQAPLFFARLRRPQMLIAIAGLIVLLASSVTHTPS